MNTRSNNDEPVLAESDPDDDQSQHPTTYRHIKKPTPISEWQHQKLIMAGGKRWEESGKKRIYVSRKAIITIIEFVEPVRYGCPRRKLPSIPDSIWMDCRTGQWGCKGIIGKDVLDVLRKYLGE